MKTFCPLSFVLRPLVTTLLACLVVAVVEVIWFIETTNGALVYTVTYNANGISIAEGLKPLKSADLTAESAKNFIQDQVSLIKDSSTTRIVKPGEKYEFAKQAFVCAENEFVVLDQTNDLLIIWSRGSAGTILAVSREMIQRTGG